jgi:SET domain-containing protein
MDINLINFGLEVKQSPIHRWGVFATQSIKKNQTILQCICIVIPKGEYCPTPLLPYTFTALGDLFISMGIASLINSSKTPNVTFDYNQKEKILNIISLRDINSLEEITLDYM